MSRPNTVLQDASLGGYSLALFPIVEKKRGCGVVWCGVLSCCKVCNLFPPNFTLEQLAPFAHSHCKQLLIVCFPMEDAPPLLLFQECCFRCNVFPHRTCDRLVGFRNAGRPLVSRYPRPVRKGKNKTHTQEKTNKKQLEPTKT